MKERAGTLRPCRQRNEPTPTVELPKKPAWLKGKAAKHWKHLAPVLVDNGLLTKLDAIALSMLCIPLTEFILAREIVDAAEAEEGTRFITKTDKGNVIQHPAVGVMNKAWDKVVKILREFGMTPSARAGLAIDSAKGEADPLAAILAGMQNRN